MKKQTKKSTKKIAKKVAAKPTKKSAKKIATKQSKKVAKRAAIRKVIAKFVRNTTNQFPPKKAVKKKSTPKKNVSKKIGSKPQSRKISRSELSRKRLISKNLMNTIAKQFQIMLSPNEFIVRLIASDMQEIEQHLAAGKSLVYCLLHLLRKWHPDYFEGVELRDASPAPRKDELGEITDGTMLGIAASSPGNWQTDETSDK